MCKSNSFLENDALFPKVTCPYCQSSVTDIKSHLSKEKQNSLCNVCDLAIPNKKCVAKHKKVVHQLPVEHSTCQECSIDFSSEKFLKIHNTLFHPNDMEIHECKYCEVLLPRRDDLQIHIENANHTASQCDCEGHGQVYNESNVKRLGFECDTCYEHFDLASDLMKHRFAFHNNEIKPNLGNSKKIPMTFIDDLTLPEIEDYKPIVESQILNETDKVHDLIDQETSADMDIDDRMRYYTINQMQENIEIDNPENPEGSKCKECNEGFCREQCLKKSDLKCDFCERILSSKHALQRHVETVHDGIKKFRCDNCDAAFSEKRVLSRHKIRVHYQNEPIKKTPEIFQCKECNRTFTKKAVFENHMVAIHNQTSNFKCNECGKSFGTSWKLDRHIKGVHRGERNHGCGNCGKSFFEKYDLLSHERLCIDEHDESSKFKCSECGKSFGNNTKLNRHIKGVHKGEKNHECNNCGKTFLESYELRNHFKNSTCPENLNMKTHKCDYCEEAFHNQSLLRKHMKDVHGKCLQFPCPECGQKFVRNAKLNIHVRFIHNKVQEGTCGQCKKSFSNKDSLKLHIQRVHEGKKFK